MLGINNSYSTIGGIDGAIAATGMTKCNDETGDPLCFTDPAVYEPYISNMESTYNTLVMLGSWPYPNAPG